MGRLNLTIDDEFRQLLRPLTEQERTRLMINIERDGQFLDPLIVWAEEGILVDGHNRYELHQRALEHIPEPEVRELSFPDRDAVKSWIVDNQNGRRNNDKWVSYHNGAKPKTESGRPKNCDNESQLTPPAERKQAQRDRDFREACDAVEEQEGEAVLHEMMADPKVSKAEITRRAATPHVTQNSGNNEWYTPARFVDLARNVMGGIDLDPASSEVANQTVKAEQFFTIEDDGLQQAWAGRVWLNPPYGKDQIAAFAEKFAACEFAEGIALVNNATETTWFQALTSEASAVCFPLGRIKFNDHTGTPRNTPLQGQAVVYSGANTDRFAEQFSAVGQVYRRVK